MVGADSSALSSLDFRVTSWCDTLSKGRLAIHAPFWTVRRTRVTTSESLASMMH